MNMSLSRNKTVVAVAAATGVVALAWYWCKRGGSGDEKKEQEVEVSPKRGSSASNPIVIGSRKSELAMIQARHVLKLLQEAFPDKHFVIRNAETAGDKNLSKPLSHLASGAPGLFTKELEEGLYARRYDLAVHSLKDVPTLLPPKLILSAITKREDPTDAFVLAKKHIGTVASITDLPKGALIGTSALRRQALIHNRYKTDEGPKYRVESIRGNLNTRLKKLDAEDGEYDALVLATAGLERMGWSERITHKLSPDLFPYGISQGALGIECREGDDEIIAISQTIQDLSSAIRCTSERAFLRSLHGGCQVPIGVSSIYELGDLFLEGIVLNPEGTRTIQHSIKLPVTTLEEAAEVGARLGGQVIARGAGELLKLGEERSITYGAAEKPLDRK